ncbi:hypothetical protein HYN59_00180 [Flavobacterium album]|uniref:Ig-like domain-containing protein n=1 Tax=Flavobacterium album TaxID=2175091 RepID=A0A2S1QTC6_9FLAO|nr:T9SS type B sorting domain-containing protein [Flavobacterium album]AWH83626.1 hypothetical protein HYN59_00180 [Flavobacterium album]
MKNITLLCISLFLYTTFSYASAGLTAPPVNDECASATWLTVNTGQSCTSSTAAAFATATVSSQGTTCTTQNGGDIWYQFTATSSNHSISLSNFTGTPQPAVLVLYEGDCATLTQLYCSVNNVINANGLIPGMTYKLRTYYNLASPNNNSGFSICVATLPAPSSSNQTDCLITTINYSFESPPPPAPTTFPVFVNHNAVQGWRTTASDQMMEFWVVPNYENVPSYDGTQFIELNANLVSGVYQDYATPQPTVFNYGFAHRGRQGTDTCQLLAGPPGGPYTSVQTATTGNTAWGYYTGSYTVPAGQTTTRFIFQSVSSVGGASVGNYLDAISFTANNGILSSNPFNMGCGTGTANIAAAGTGTWVAHSDNPSSTVIANPSGNNTSITGFGAQGVYHFDWNTAYCTSTLTINFAGQEPPVPVVADVTYCQGQQADPLTAEAVPGNTLNWYPDDGAGGPPVPSTAATGTTTYYVSQTSPEGCESVAEPITVTVNTATPPVTTFSLPADTCHDGGNITPTTSTGFTSGGQFSSAAGLSIDPATGQINVASSTPGSYTVTYEITEDLSTCRIGGSSTADIIINDTPAVPDVTVTQPACDAPTGTITVNAPVGTGLLYSLDGMNYQPNPVFSGLAGGNYSVYVQNAAGCTSAPDNVTVNASMTTPAVATYNVVQPSCSSSTGTITVTAPTGAGLTYSIDGTTFQSGTSFTGLAGGTDYVVTVQNASGCTSVTNPITINAAPVMPDVPNVSTGQPDCTTPMGSITVESPLNASFTYSIDGTNYQLNPDFTGVTAGNYTVYIKSSTGCISTLSNVVIDASPFTPAAATYTVVQPTCTSATGTINVTAPVGTGYTYSIDGTTFQSGTAFSGLAGNASYTITTKNAAGCVSTSAPVTINPQPAIPEVADVTIVQPVCEIPTGSITINSPVGTAYTYSVNGTSYQASTEFANLAPADYTVYVKNASGCISQLYPATISSAAAAPPIATLQDQHPDCTTSTGTLTVLAPLGEQYTYSIDGVNFQAGTVFSGLNGGSAYSVTVKNALGCTSITVPVAIHTAPVVPTTPTATVVQPSCGDPGSITVNLPLGAGFTYSINGTTFQPNPVFMNPAPGNYTLTVKSSGGCTATSGPYSITPGLAGPGAPVLSVTQATCATPTGSISVVSPIANTLTYSIDGTTYGPGSDFLNLSPGTYTVYVQSPNGCINTQSATIAPQPVTPAPAVAFVTQADCTTGANIVITSPLGSGLTYSINGTTFQSGTTFVNVPAGNYTITTKSSGGCISVSGPYTVNPSPTAPSMPVVSITQPFCATTTGTITVSSPAAPGMTYSIGSGFQVSNIFTNVAPGTYVLTAQNADGCTSNKSVTINPAQALPAVASVTVVNPDCDHLKGTITIDSPIGAGLSYSINGTSFQTGTYFANIAPGNYTVTVKNSDGCTSVTPVIAIANPTPIVNAGIITGGTEVCAGETLQLANVVTGGTWSSSSPAVATISATGEVTGLSEGYTLITYDVPGTATECHNTATLLFSVNGLPDLDIHDAFLCENLTTGEYSSTTLDTGLSGGYTFTWDKDGTALPDLSAAITVDEPGVYTVTITDTTTGCTGTATSTVGVSSVPLAIVEAGSDFQNNQTITVSVTGGSGNYMYSLDGGPFQSEPYFTNIGQGEYTVTVKDTNGCGETVYSVTALNYPHFFSPNGDGERDTWNITGLSSYTTEISIFDRFGKAIAVVKPGGHGWDGTFNGAVLPATDYWFVVKYKSNGKDKEFKSHFSLIR